MKLLNTKPKKIIFIIILILTILGSFLHFSHFSIQSIKGEKLIQTSTSPSGKYEIHAYLNNGGATTSYAVLGTLINNETGREKNIYWEYRIDKADITWINDEIVSINNTMLNVKHDIYDFRKK